MLKWNQRNRKLHLTLIFKGWCIQKRSWHEQELHVSAPLKNKALKSVYVDAVSGYGLWQETACSYAGLFTVCFSQYNSICNEMPEPRSFPKNTYISKERPIKPDEDLRRLFLRQYNLDIYEVNKTVFTSVSRDFEESNMQRIFTLSARYLYYFFLFNGVHQMHAVFMLLSDSHYIFMEQMPVLPAGFPKDLAAWAHLIFYRTLLYCCL